MFVRDGAVTPGPSRECDITFFVKGRPKPAQQLHDSTVVSHRAQSVTVPSSWVSHECRSPGLRSLPLKMPEISRHMQERKISPQRKFWAGYPCGHPAKNFSQALQTLKKKQAFWHGHTARTSMRKTLV